MVCFSPLPAYSGDINPKTLKFKTIVLKATKANLESYAMRVPCGKCSGCRLEYSRQWAIRCMHESHMHDFNSFITLTYNNEFLPHNSSLNYNDWTKFMKRLRKRLDPIKIRFYMGPEYGSLNGRPHYHAIIFGFDFPDKVLYKQSNGINLYTSDLLSDLWSCPKTGKSMGFSSVGSVTFESAAYVARYMMKKVKGDDPVGRYWTEPDDYGEVLKIEPEKARMSNKPGIAKAWFDKYFYKDNMDSDNFVVLKGKEVRPPKYYDILFERIDPAAFDVIKQQRVEYCESNAADNTPERLAVRKFVREHKIKDLVRPLSSGEVINDY
jgi:hypothetical protein